jgi:glutaconyl-CoA/methylmalonyl-CoA decarboxylase subunit gamma
VKTFKVTVDGQSYHVQVEEVAEKNMNPETPSPAPASSKPAGEPKAAAVVKEEPKEASQPAAEGGINVKSPMPGSILEVRVNVGDTVKNGDVLLVLEAMKMENELTASQDGTVSQVLVKKGDTVNSGDPLIVLS